MCPVVQIGPLVGTSREKVVMVSKGLRRSAQAGLLLVLMLVGVACLPAPTQSETKRGMQMLGVSNLTCRENPKGVNCQGRYNGATRTWKGTWDAEKGNLFLDFRGTVYDINMYKGPGAKKGSLIRVCTRFVGAWSPRCFVP